MSMNNKGWIVLSVLVIIIAIPQLIALAKIERITRDMLVLEPSAKQTTANPTQDRIDLSAVRDVSGRLDNLRRQLHLTVFLSVVMAMLFVGGALRGFKKFSSNIVVELDQLAGRIDSTSYAIKSASTLLSDDTRRQSSAIMQTARAHKHIAALSRDNAAHAGDANARIREYVEKIEAADHTLRKLIESMNDIKLASEGIQKIVDDINAIAAKTNLLAINAGVESVKAGEAGKAFGIIASEVRNLALGSSNSAKQTNSQIESAIGKINNGAAMVGEVVTVFRDTIARVEDLKINIEAISASALDQSEQLNSLDATLDELEFLTDRNVDNSEETATISEELQTSGEALRFFLGNIIQKTISGRKLSNNMLTQTFESIEKLAFQLQAAGGDGTQHKQILASWKAEFNQRVEAIYTCRDDGAFIYSNPPAGIPNARVRPWWQKAMDGTPYMSPVYISAINQKPCCTISVPFYSDRNRIAGVLGVDLKI